jgi:polyisoprenoid-binding protein YceI
MLVTFATATALSVAAAQGPAKASTQKRGATSAATGHYIVAPTGNEARYRVREQLAGFDLPNDAIGVVHDIAGALVIDGSGAVVPDSSRVTVTLTALKSDKDRRDGFLQRRLLETDNFPTVELAPQGFRGLAGKLPSTPTAFELVSNLTIRGVVRPAYRSS